MPSKTAILILNFNGSPHLDVCLRAVIREANSGERVYLVDNNSTDGSVEYVRERFRSVSIIQFDRNLGFAEAYNNAALKVDADVLVLLNNDVEVAPNWLRELVLPLEGSDNPLAICGSKILFYSVRDRVNHAGGRLVPLGGGIDLDFLEPDYGKPKEPELVGCVSGASMAVRRPIFLQLGGFDGDYFSYFEDVDLCWRAWLAGYQVMVNPRSRVYHKVSGTWGPFLKPERVYLGERNRLQCLLKNSELRNVVPAMLISLLYTLARTIEFLSLGFAAPVQSLGRAYWWNLLNHRCLLVKRRIVQRDRMIRDAFLVKNGLMTTYLEGLHEYLRLAYLRRKYPEIFSIGSPESRRLR